MQRNVGRGITRWAIGRSQSLLQPEGYGRFRVPRLASHAFRVNGPDLDTWILTTLLMPTSTYPDRHVHVHRASPCRGVTGNERAESHLPWINGQQRSLHLAHRCEPNIG